MKILSIDAWGNKKDGYVWNNWYKVGEYPADATDTKSILKYLRDNNILSQFSIGKVTVEDDGYNYVIIERNNQRPLYALEYGSISDSQSMLCQAESDRLANIIGVPNV